MKTPTKKRRGAASSTQPGRKPAVAAQLEALAKASLNSKLSLIVAALKDCEQTGAPIPKELPTSRRQFLFWQPLTDEGVTLPRNSNDTLKKYPLLLESIETAINGAKAITQAQKETNKRSKETRLATSLRAQQLHWNLRTIAERALVSARDEVAALRKTVSHTQAQLASAEREFRITCEALVAECDSLRRENARLTSQLAKTIPFKSLL